MQILLLAASSTVDASIPWWLHALVVPVAVGMLSSLVGLAASLLLASRTEWYRRVFRWEPYSRELWLLQVRLYGEICQAAKKVLLAARKMAFD